jgi:hypothetical protein
MKTDQPTMMIPGIASAKLRMCAMLNLKENDAIFFSRNSAIKFSTTNGQYLYCSNCSSVPMYHESNHMIESNKRVPSRLFLFAVNSVPYCSLETSRWQKPRNSCYKEQHSLWQTQSWCTSEKKNFRVKGQIHLNLKENDATLFSRNSAIKFSTTNALF